MAKRTLQGFDSSGVELVLSGHFHSFRVKRASESVRGLKREIYIILSGSSTSSRVGRRYHTGNGFVAIQVVANSFRATHYLFVEGRGFEADEEVILERGA